MKTHSFSLRSAAGLLLVATAAAAELWAAPQVESVVIPVLEPNGVFEWNATRTWLDDVSRAENAPGGVLLGDKSRSLYVPHFAEYRLDLAQGGRYRLSALWAPVEGTTRISVWLNDGELARDVAVKSDPAAQNATPVRWQRLGDLTASAGTHRLQLLVRDVDQRFPRLERLKLEYLGGPAPAPREPRPLPRFQRPADWINTISRKVHADFHTTGYVRGVGSRFDAEEFSGRLVAADVGAITLFGKCVYGYAYYNTAVGTRHPGLDFDLLAAQIRACKSKGIKVWVYYTVALDGLYASYIQSKSAAGQAARSVDTKPDTRYVTEYVWPMVDELLTYDIDGLWFDYPGCDEFVEQTARRVRARRPELIVAFNHLFDRPRSRTKDLDIIELEVWDHDYYPRTQMLARYLHGAIPLTSMSTRFWGGWGNFGGFSSADRLRWQAGVALANGVWLSIGDQINPNGRLEPYAYRVIGEAYRFQKLREPWVQGAEFVPYVGVLEKPTERVVPPTSVPPATAATLGTTKALVDAGIHFRHLDDDADLTPYAAVVLPERPVDAAIAQRLAEYVQGGGKLILVGTVPKELADLAGVVEEGTPARGYILPTDKLLRETMPDGHVFSYEPAVLVKAKEGTEVLADWVFPMAYGTPQAASRGHHPPAEQPSGYAAATLRSVGSKGGRIAVIAPAVFAAYHKQGYHALRQLFEGVLARTLPVEERLVSVTGPVNLEVSLMRQPAQGGRVIIHLVSLCQDVRADGRVEVFDRIPPIHDVTLRISPRLMEGRQGKIYQAPEGTTLDAKKRDGFVEIQVPRMHIHTMVVIE